MEEHGCGSGAGNQACPPKVLGEKQHDHRTAKIVCREDDGNWIGYLQEFPDDWTQGDSLEDLHAQLRDLYRDLASGELPGNRRVRDIAVA